MTLALRRAPVAPWHALQALDLSPEELAARIVEPIDIAMDPVDKYLPEEDPTKFVSQKANRGPFTQDWQVRLPLNLCREKTREGPLPRGWQVAAAFSRAKGEGQELLCF